MRTANLHDLTINQLLNIAKAPPGHTHFPAHANRPAIAELDIAHLSPSFDGMTVVEFNAWISGAEHDAYRWITNEERTVRVQLQAMRALHVQIREQQRLATNLATKRTLDAAVGEIAQAWNTTEERLAGCSRRIA